jgi:hypothetical protein
MTFKDLMNKQDNIIERVTKIINGDHLLTEEHMRQLNDLRLEALEVEKQIYACPYFHPETLHVPYLQ